MIDYLKEVAPGRFSNELTNMMNDRFGTQFTKKQIVNLKTREKIKSKVSGMPKELYAERRLTTPEQEKFIRQHQDGMYTEELVTLVNEKFNTNFTQGQMQSYKSRNGLSSGLKTNFKQGQPAWNKGKKQSDYMSVESIERTKATRFKKGLVPPNWLPIGSERVSVDGYVEIKVRDGESSYNYELKHRLIWEKHHTKIPTGHVVMFKNGNSLDLDIRNLMLVSRGQLAVFNKQYKRTESPILNEAILNKIKLDLTLKELKT